VLGERFDEAADAYRQILEQTDQQDDLDLRLRLARCLEQAGKMEEAGNIYHEIVDIYQVRGETGAAHSLKEIIERLRESDAAASAEAEEEGEAPAEIPELDETELIAMLRDMGIEQHADPESYICHTGDTPHALWLLAEGTVQVTLPDYDEPDVVMARDGALALLGEQGLFTHQRQPADIQAVDACTYYSIPTETIYARQKTDPAFHAAMERLLRQKWVEPVLRRHVVFERINDIDRMRLAGAFERIRLEPGEVLLHAREEHDGAYLLQSGCLFFMHDEDAPASDASESEDALLTSVLPGDMIHLGGLLDGFRSEYRIIAATPVELLHLSRERFEPFTLRRPWIIQALVRYSRRPVHLQVLRPEDDYLWTTQRHITLRKVR